MIDNRWNGERISIAPGSPVGLIQCHLSRYVWAMHYCVGKTVLDVGCGTGYGTWLLGTVAEDIYGIDKSVDAIAEAMRDFNGVFFNTPLEATPASMSGKFDTVVAFEVMEHLDDVDVGMEAVKSLLKDDGTFVLSLPLHQPSHWHHLRDFGYGEWREIVERHFEIDSVYYQPIENERGDNVSIRPAGYRVDDKFVEDWHECAMKCEPETGIVVFVVKKK